jgi:hypothetical protein
MSGLLLRRQVTVALVALAAVVAGVSLLARQGGSAQVEPLNGPAIQGYTYSAKFVCGNPAGLDPQPLASGVYSTAINVHNLQAFDVTLIKKAVLAPQEPDLGQPSPFQSIAVPADRAFEIDCPDIFSLLDLMPPFPAFAKGFVVIESPAELDVWGVYTSSESAAGAGTGITLDVEVVPYELQDFCDITVLGADPDADNLTTAQELAIGTHPCINDTDKDSCADGEETVTGAGAELLGGNRDPLNPWDFYNVVDPIAPRVIDLDDAFAVLYKFGAVYGDPVPVAPPYDARHDRTTPSPNYWNTQAPEGVIDLDDFFWNLVQFGHTCFPAP